LKRFAPLQCGPRGRGRRQSGEISARAGGGAGRGRAWGGAGVVRDRIRPKLGAVVVLRSRAAAAVAASRGMPGSGELPAGAFELAARSAPVEARGDPGTVARPRKLVGTRLGGGGHGARRQSKGQWPTVLHARRGAAFLYSRRESSLLTGGRTTVAPRGNAWPDDTGRIASRGAVVRRRGARGVLGMRAGMGKE
jgi:hypothetical protein